MPNINVVPAIEIPKYTSICINQLRVNEAGYAVESNLNQGWEIVLYWRINADDVLVIAGINTPEQQVIHESLWNYDSILVQPLPEGSQIVITTITK